MKKVKCKNCSRFMYTPPYIQRELNDPTPFHCLKDVWRDEDDPAEFEKKIKCKKYEKARPGQAENTQELRRRKPLNGKIKLTRKKPVVLKRRIVKLKRKQKVH